MPNEWCNIFLCIPSRLGAFLALTPQSVHVVPQQGLDFLGYTWFSAGEVLDELANINVVDTTLNVKQDSGDKISMS